MEYQNRVVVYIDILGFKDLLDETIDREGNDIPKGIDKILDAYNAIRDVWDLDIDEKKKWGEDDPRKDNGKVITMFSDTIVISFLQDAESEIFWTLLEINWMIARLMIRGILCRGAVSYGKLIHDDKKIFGPALVNAYIGESKAALYPRVILSPEILELVEKAKASHNAPQEEKEYVMDLLDIDSDGMLYVDYFDSIRSEFDDPIYGYPDYLIEMRKTILKGISSGRPDVKIKYMWLKERYNETIDKLDINNTVLRLREEGNEDDADLYESIKPI